MMLVVSHGICPECSQQVLPGGAAALPGTGLVVCLGCFTAKTGRHPLPSQTLSLPGGTKLASRSGVIIGPDVCLTPGDGLAPHVPVPYPNVMSTAAAGATKSTAAPPPSPGPLTPSGISSITKSVVQFVTMPTRVRMVG
jgi:hypothetical protein